MPLNPSVEGDGVIYWVKPQHNEVKVTADAAVFEEQGIAGLVSLLVIMRAS